MSPTVLLYGMGLLKPTPPKKRKRARRAVTAQANTPRTAPVPAPRVAFLA